MIKKVLNLIHFTSEYNPNSFTEEGFYLKGWIILDETWDDIDESTKRTIMEFLKSFKDLKIISISHTTTIHAKYVMIFKNNCVFIVTKREYDQAFKI